MWPIALTWIMRVIPVIPSLVTDIENLWRQKPKAGQAKWIAVEQALSGSISDVAQELMGVAPAGTKVEDISAAAAIFAKSVNDASVAFANALHVFPTTAQPAQPAAPIKVS